MKRTQMKHFSSLIVLHSLFLVDCLLVLKLYLEIMWKQTLLFFIFKDLALTELP